MTISFDSKGEVEPLYDIVNYGQVNNEAQLNKIGIWSSTVNHTKFLQIDNNAQIHFGLDPTNRAIL